MPNLLRTLAGSKTSQSVLTLRKPSRQPVCRRNLPEEAQDGYLAMMSARYPSELDRIKMEWVEYGSENGESGVLECTASWVAGFRTKEGRLGGMRVGYGGEVIPGDSSERESARRAGAREASRASSEYQH
ncbi:hypothetical protein C8F01DRAFT_1086197 [Mycena amicta]|nr:hypothetical protein C8F01DRAFT_1086197 [Mycena amicta]